eukprot:TRINITY_DN8570_c0_g3_i1.p1 TRINITY_DN8570_c0_g3~~TRINITY_DN8570_c0_g3_i1.p1  ORF type:complete len:166 (+),score=37.24 TRINITY_DN8570_c0_g3_i1:67-564(+)
MSWSGSTAVMANKSDGSQVLSVDGRVGVSGIGLGIEGNAQVLSIHNDKTGMNIDARFLGVGAGAKVGLDPSAIWSAKNADGKAALIGGKAEAHLKMVEADVGPFHLNLGLGLDTGAKVENSTVDVGALGCGVKVGRKIGVSVVGNEFSVDIVEIGKGIGQALGWC